MHQNILNHIPCKQRDPKSSTRMEICVYATELLMSPHSQLQPILISPSITDLVKLKSGTLDPAVIMLSPSPYQSFAIISPQLFKPAWASQILFLLVPVGHAHRSSCTEQQVSSHLACRFHPLFQNQCSAV